MLLDCVRCAYLWQSVLHVGSLEGPPAHLLGLHVDHTTARDCGRGGLFKVSGFKDQVHLVAHLDDLSTHQTKLHTKKQQQQNKYQM